MSANIYWTPGAVERNSIHTSTPQAFMRVLKVLNWELGDKLDESFLPSLRALAEVCHESERKAYKQLIDAIERHKEIRVWAEY
jgi:hypothetical protein